MNEVFIFYFFGCVFFSNYLQIVKSFYASYAHKYDQDLEKDQYKAPFLISSWILEELAHASKSKQLSLPEFTLNMITIYIYIYIYF